jgi:hypothetical protein
VWTNVYLCAILCPSFVLWQFEIVARYVSSRAFSRLRAMVVLRADDSVPWFPGDLLPERAGLAPFLIRPAYCTAIR